MIAQPALSSAYQLAGVRFVVQRVFRFATLPPRPPPNTAPVLLLRISRHRRPPHDSASHRPAAGSLRPRHRPTVSPNLPPVPATHDPTAAVPLCRSHTCAAIPVPCGLPPVPRPPSASPLTSVPGRIAPSPHPPLTSAVPLNGLFLSHVLSGHSHPTFVYAILSTRHPPPPPSSKSNSLGSITKVFSLDLLSSCPQPRRIAF
ncbi:hypothetical protein DFH08DRAFT_959930 [Mycena albidolilacea]|uniref:Uncharacterized protein n=1 Tax=Mycena albidolilacea TaxID=1033008 RepID=A0AAD7A317_9AGAR|nr:hypothetical protein DFH08DRAFT_959930 [Mycena albidolilacea]